MYIQQQEDGTIFLTAPVMIPNARDCDYENGEPPLTADQILAFKQSYDKYAFVDHEHKLTNPKQLAYVDVNFTGKKIGDPHKSIILDQDTTFSLYDGTEKMYPKGTWMLTTHITDEEAISEAMKGRYTGYSPSVMSKRKADQYLAALKSENECACKHLNSAGTGLISQVPNAVVLSVSLTKQPCLHESKFCELDNMEEDVQSFKSKVLSAIGMSEEAEVLALKAEVNSLEEKIDKMQNDFTEALKSMQEEFTQTLTEALKSVDEEVAEEEAETEETTEEEAEVTVEEEVEEEATPEEEEVAEKAEEEVVAEKGESKQEPVHDNIEAAKSKPTNIYKLMGRNPDGTKIRK